MRIVLCRLPQGAWQGDLLNVSQPLGVCTLNTADCGKLGGSCDLEGGVVGSESEVRFCRSQKARSCMPVGMVVPTHHAQTPGRQCCREDVPETGPVMICETSAQPGTHYCTEANVCTKCPATPVTQLQKENCLGPSGSIEAGRSARRFGRAG